MGKMRCQCGHVMHLSGSNSSYEFLLVPLNAMENIVEKMDDGNFSSDDFWSDINHESLDVCRCTECGRLYIKSGDSGVYDLYEKRDA